MTAERVIRSLAQEEAEILVDWARVEGWNPGLADAPALYAADPQGFIGCFVGNRLAAGISAVRYGSNFGFIGLYIADPEFRGKGFGRKVWDAGMAHLEGRAIGLDGVPEQQTNYRCMGFEVVYETSRWSGRFDGRVSKDVVPITADLLPALINFDRSFFPTERVAFLGEWLKPPRIARIIIRSGTIRGYAVVRRCHEGWKVGPLFAETTVDAKTLLATCSDWAGGEMLHIDVPAAQTTFTAALADQGFSQGFTTARMYRGPIPVVNMDGVFGITTLELG